MDSDSAYISPFIYPHRNSYCVTELPRPVNSCGLYRRDSRLRSHLVEELNPLPHELIFIRWCLIVKLRHIKIGRQ